MTWLPGEDSNRAGQGTREYIRVLRLLETHSLRDLARAVARGLHKGALTRDAIAQFLLPPEEPRAATFHLDGREHLSHVQVAQSNVTAYRALLPQGGAR